MEGVGHGEVGAERKPVEQIVGALDHVRGAGGESGQGQFRQAAGGTPGCRDLQVVVHKQIAQVGRVGRVAQQRSDAEDFLQRPQNRTVRVIQSVVVAVSPGQR